MPNVNTATTPRIIALLIGDASDTHELARYAKAVLNAAHVSAQVSDRTPEVLAVCVAQAPDTRLLDSLQQLPLHAVVSLTVADLQSPSCAADFARALERTLTSGAIAPLSANDLICAPAGALGEEVAARLAAKFDGVALGRIQRFGFDALGLYAHKPVFGGRALACVQSANGPWFGAWRADGPSQLASPAPDTTQVTARHDETARSGPHDPDEIVLQPANEQRRPVETARVVVSGGRGMQGAEGFALLEALASRLDGAVGGSLPAVDAGWVPVTHQVGQSGKFVTPTLYLAIGISGTPQHLAGIGNATRIVAINNDPHADIFRVADLGILADWASFLPALIARFDADQASRTGGA